MGGGSRKSAGSGRGYGCGHGIGIRGGNGPRLLPSALLGLAAGLLVASGARAACEPLPEDAVVEIQTPLGEICLEMLGDEAPGTVANFLGYVARGDFENGFFHRLATGFVLQGGGFRVVEGELETIPTQDPIVNEFGESNLRGTVAMAKQADDPDSATNQWFVNLADNSLNLDNQNGGFTVFARVREEDMGVVDALAALPVEDGRFATDAAARNAWDTIPVLEAFELDPLGYGCFDLSQMGFFGEVVGNQAIFDPDPVTGGLRYVSTACIGESGNPCGDPDTDIVGVDIPTGQPFVADPDTLTCSEVLASDAGFAARVADLEPQLVAGLATMTGVQAVPEPGALFSGLGLLGALATLARRRRR